MVTWAEWPWRSVVGGASVVELFAAGAQQWARLSRDASRAAVAA
jgi:hypothetical protein